MVVIRKKFSSKNNYKFFERKKNIDNYGSENLRVVLKAPQVAKTHKLIKISNNFKVLQINIIQFGSFY